MKNTDGNDAIHAVRPEEEDRFYALIWMDQLQSRLDALLEAFPEERDGIAFECWLDRYLDIDDQLNMAKRVLKE